MDREARFIAPMNGIELRDSGAGPGVYTIKGHAAVFDRYCDFGMFRERIAPGAFETCLRTNPLEVLAVWNHDPSLTLATTMNRTLELAEDEDGLKFWAQVAPTSYAADLKVLLERGDMQQASFKFTIGKETWDYDETEGREDITVTIEEVECLYDVSVCGLGAYSQTDVQLSSRNRLTDAIEHGRVPGLTLDDARTRGVILDPERSRKAGEDVAAPETVDDADERAEWLAQAREAHQSAEMLTAARAM